uniref:HTH_7 domain-containing protein n=1 Tax=Heterorhabditis bacteriophora TaxID=37862 RepID=A0A1I7XSU7_HETBA
MGRAPTPSLHERSQIKALSTAGYSLKQIADVVKCSRKATEKFLRLQEEYGQFCGQRQIARLASTEFVGLVASMLQKLRCGE